MNRRVAITLLGGAAAWPVAARAQQPTMPVIGFLGSVSPNAYADRAPAFREGLAETGYVEGRTVTIEYRWPERANDSLEALAADLVRRPVTAIMAGGEPSAFAAKNASSSVPIIFVGGSDPISVGLVASMNRPGGNITGVTVLNVSMTPKRLQMLKELVPSAATVAVLIDPTAPGFETQVKELQSAAPSLGMQIRFLNASTAREIDIAFASLSSGQIGGVVVGASPFFNARSEQLGGLAVHHAIPTIFQTRDFAAAGGLMSYGGSIPDAYRLAGVYVGRVLKGEKPVDLPVQQTTKVEMILNLKTAKALGLTVSLPLLGRADEVIE